MAEFIGVLADGRVVYAKRRAGVWAASAGSTLDDAYWPGASDPANRVRLRHLRLPEGMRLDGRNLGYGAADDAGSAEADLAAMAAGIMDLTGVRWVDVPHDAGDERIVALVRAAA